MLHLMLFLCYKGSFKPEDLESGHVENKGDSEKDDTAFKDFK